MKIIRIIIAILISLVECSIAYANPNQARIKQIVVGPQGSDKPNNFSLNFVLQLGNKNLSNWKFGFYMPRNFRQTTLSNRKLTMRICETGSKNCSLLIYLKSPFNANDLSTVFVTIVKPAQNYILKSGKSYTLSFLHNSSRGPENYSSLPQSIFLINQQDEVIPLPTTPNIYSITNYQATKVKAEINQHIQANWQNSATDTNILNVIPAPTQVDFPEESAVFKLSKLNSIHDFSQMPEEQLELWQKTINKDLKIRLKVDKNTDNNGILLENRNISSNNPEGYEIEIDETQIKVLANNQAGFFYALQTLRQLWFNNTSIPAVKIVDYPRFRYRGVLLDVARHYFTIDELKDFIDLMAAIKLNTLHLHLSDDEAFRLNLEDFPELTQVGARRGLGNKIGPMALIQKNLSKNRSTDNLPSADTTYAGSYSGSEIKQLINYANLHQITIIPEIDIPGHSRAIMKALPDAFYEPGDHSEYAGYGDNSLPVCAYGSTSDLGQKFTSTLTNLIYQTSQLFNQQQTLYAVNNEISIGGDEVFKGTWDDAPSCKTAPWNKMNELEKEHYFLDLLNNDAKINRLRLSGWHEFVLNNHGKINLKHGIKPEEIGHVWLWGKQKDSMGKAVTLANAGYPVVLEYSDLLYMDITYSRDVKEPGLYWASRFNDTYALLSSSIAASQTLYKTNKPQQIVGLEGALWTDVIPSYTHLQYMSFPKMTGLAEAAWSKSTNQLPQWHSLAKRLGCGQTGFLAYINKQFGSYYRGYPNGIKAEAPNICLQK